MKKYPESVFCCNDLLHPDTFFLKSCICCLGPGTLVWKNGAGASSVYDPVGNIDPHGPGKQSDPTGIPFV